jgi:MFS family permease
MQGPLRYTPRSDSDSAPGGLGGAISSLRNPQFRWLYISNIAFFMAMGSQQIVRSWITFQLTDSKLALGLISFTVALPMLFISPLGGALADRLERRSLIVAGQAMVVLSELAIFGLLYTDRLLFWHLVVAAGVMGVVFPFIMPARQAIVANVVGRAGLTNAMALTMAGMNMTRIIGPAAAGFLIGVVGVESTYVVGISLYAVGLVCLFQVEQSRPAAETRELSITRNMADGARYVGQNRLVLVLLFFGLVPMFLAMPFQTLLVVFADEIWNVGSWGLGLLSAAGGLGGVVGSMYVAWRSDSHKRVRPMMVSMVAFGIFLLLFAISPWFLLALPLVFAANIFASVYGTLNNTAIQLLIPDQVRGRISSFLMMSFSLPLLGTLPMSAVAEVYGAQWAVAGASLLAVVVAVVFYLSSSELRKMDDSVRDAMVD